MFDVYCHIHTPINIEENNWYLIPPIIHNGNLYVIKEKKLQDVLIFIGYFQEYIMYTREYGYEYVTKWLKKKNLLNSNILESVSQYWIEDISFRQINNYKYFKKNEYNKAVIPDKYIKNIFKKILFYTYIKENQDEFNDITEKKLNLIENELSFKSKTNYKYRQNHYRNNIYEVLLNKFNEEYINNQKLNDINNIKFNCDTLLNQYDLFVYKIANINEYKNYNFKLTGTEHAECLRENSFVKINISSEGSYYEDDYLMHILKMLKLNSQIFANDMVDFGINHLKKIISNAPPSAKSTSQTVKYRNNEESSSNVALLQKTQTIISETEEHIISRYNSLKNYTNIYFAPDKEITALIAVLNMDKENLKRLNNLVWEKPNKIETDLIKFTFKKGNLPYSAYGFASLNF